MPLQLKDAIDRLYRPPKDGVRQVLAVSRSVAEKLPRLESVAVISVTAPGRPLANLEGFKQVLRLSFADVDFMSPELSARAKEKMQDAFRPEHAAEIRDFVEGLSGGVATVVIHCEGGYSRSCAIALALHRLYGYQTDIGKMGQANPSVLRLLTQGAGGSR
ncbi:hypothetical protein [Cupriavidus metallidurans]|uniref:hypothetical protein n=1 Tax=Cupriavidus metallidurans TaxID=119219 RepID=UPI00056A3BA7|nr:hypothetical protein [Cupriavidus metallidurans]